MKKMPKTNYSLPSQAKLRSIPRQKRNPETELYILEGEKGRLEQELAKLLTRKEYIEHRLAEIQGNMQNVTKLWQKRLDEKVKKNGLEVSSKRPSRYA